MSESAAVATPIKASMPSLKPGQVFLSGRVDNVRKFDGRVFTRLVLPAADAYSHPDMVEVESRQTLGQIGDDWRGVCRIGGYRNEFNSTDEMGDKRIVKSARNTLVVVD